jgi:sialic acid synthase SpsE
MEPIKIIAEIGINHNGNLEHAKQLIDEAIVAKFDYVKFQKRTPDICVPEHKKADLKETPWGKMTYLEYKHRLELSKKDYDEINSYCSKKEIKWFASVWDIPSAEFMSEFVSIVKIPSAQLTNTDLLVRSRQLFDTLILSTGMSTEEEIKTAIDIAKPDVVMHTNSTYPTPVEHLNLEYIQWLSDTYKTDVGYSGHEYGLTTTFATVPMGVKWIERHITLDRTMWGSDQLSSVEPIGMIKLVKGIRAIEKALGGYGPRKLLDGELSKKENLRTS